MAEIVIDDETLEITNVRETSWSGLYMVESGGLEYHIADSAETAGKAAREYWKELAESDPGEFTAIVGQETLVKWALGQYAGPGTTQVKSLEEWLDLHIDVPEEQWAGYDGEERSYTISRESWEEIAEDFGIELAPAGVAYRWN